MYCTLTLVPTPGFLGKSYPDPESVAERAALLACCCILGGQIYRMSGRWGCVCVCRLGFSLYPVFLPHAALAAVLVSIHILFLSCIRCDKGESLWGMVYVEKCMCVRALL